MEEKPVKRGRGRPKFVPTPQQFDEVCRLGGIGLNNDQLAAWLEISPECFDKLLARDEKLKCALSKARARALGAVVNALYGQAVTGKNMTATIFYLKTRGRWAEARDTEPTDEENQKAKEFILNYKQD